MRRIKMSKKHVITSVLLAALTVLSLTSCSEEAKNELGIATSTEAATAVVTNEKGEAVTDEGGNVVTVPVGDQPYNAMLNGDKVINVEITMSEDDLNSMRQNASAELYYHAKVSVDGAECGDAGIRTRGNVTYVSNNSSTRYSYKINFGKYTKGTKLNGLDEMCLNNMAYDPSFLREYLTYKAFYALDASAPLCSLATVSVNGETAGVYLALEAVDDSFLKRVFGSNDGNLYKAKKGSTLENGAVGFELKDGEDLSLSYIKKLSNALNGEGDIEACLDVSSVLKYIAVNSVTANESSYMGKSAENFYFYEQNGKLTMLPWDYNLAFGTDKSERKNTYTIQKELINASVSNPYFETTGEERPLASVLLANDKYYEEYIGYVKKLTEYFDSLQTSLAQYKALVEQQVTGDTSKFYTNELFKAEFTDGENTLLGFINARNKAVKAQISAD